MKGFVLVCAALAAAVLGMSASAPAFAAKRGYVECGQVAFQLGFRTGNGNENRARRRFIRSCQHGQV
ncbi:MAG TPA: hypothetical protein VGC77_16900 [Rhodopseudomonas sp.]|uniref:hypothetical protein n=1 Tax=Rhodopseudomonas sp. TaxID=1078 RepID=UPI002ED8EED1